MSTPELHSGRRMLALPLALVIALGPAGFAPRAFAQQGVPAYSQAPDERPIDQQELDRILAPIALYPDSLLSQILMASTYPLEVVEASRWSRRYPHLKGDAAVRAAAGMNWDPSVQSLVAFPQILTMMDEKLDWTQSLGDAFLSDEARVMDAIQELRRRAYASGHLRSDGRIAVKQRGNVMIVEPADPQIVYVPYYDPRVVYGSWWWAVPPVYWGPWPGYRIRPGTHIGFFWGGGIALSAAYVYGRFDWPERRVNVVRVQNHYNTVIINRNGAAPRSAPSIQRAQAEPSRWRHDPGHRRGIPYRDPQVRQQFATAAPQRPPEEGRPAEARRPPQEGRHFEAVRPPEERRPSEERRHAVERRSADERRAPIGEARMQEQPVRKSEQRMPDSLPRADPARDQGRRGDDRGRADTGPRRMPEAGKEAARGQPEAGPGKGRQREGRNERAAPGKPGTVPG